MPKALGEANKSERRAGAKKHNFSFCVLYICSMFCVRRLEKDGNARFFEIKITFLGDKITFLGDKITFLG
jgi:hypothetical protein